MNLKVSKGRTFGKLKLGKYLLYWKLSNSSLLVNSHLIFLLLLFLVVSCIHVSEKKCFHNVIVRDWIPERYKILKKQQHGNEMKTFLQTLQLDIK